MVHLGEKEVPKPCPDCGKNYTMRAMREHRKRHHEAEHVGKRYPCPQCNKQFKRPGDVRRHIREVHQKCRYVCQYCEKSFSQQAKLKLHVRSLHMGNYPHICNLCGKGFLRPSTLK